MIKNISPLLSVFVISLVISSTAVASDLWQPLDEAYSTFSGQELHQIMRVEESDFARDRALARNLNALISHGAIKMHGQIQVNRDELFIRASEAGRWMFSQYNNEASFLFWNEEAVSEDTTKTRDVFKRDRDSVLKMADVHFHKVIDLLGINGGSVVFDSVQVMMSGNYDVVTRKAEEHVGAYLGAYQRYLQDIPIIGDGGSGYILMSPDARLIGMNVDRAKYIDRGLTEHKLISYEQLRERASEIAKDYWTDSSSLVDVQCGYLDLGASLGFTHGELPLVCRVAIKSAKGGAQGAIFDIPVTEKIPELELFTEAMGLLGRKEDASDAPDSNDP